MTATRQVSTWTPTERQWAFLQRQEYEVLYGGAKFGLKTDALLAWAFGRRQRYPRSRGLFIRREISEIIKRGAAWDRTHEILGDSIEYREPPQPRVLFPNGSVQEFGHCHDENDKMHYQGAQYDDIVYDQVEQFTESQYFYIQGSCRTPRDNPPTNEQGQAIEPRIRCSANPGDVGHTWVKRYFIDIGPPNVPYETRLTIAAPDGEPIVIERSRVFIPASVFDAVKAGAVGQEYIATLEAMPEPYRTAYLYGKWDIFIGQAFMDFRPRVEGLPYHVIPADEIPPSWRRAEGHDWGFSALCYTCWGAVDPEGGIVIYKELGARGWQTDEVATQILMHRGSDRVGQTWCDPSLFRPNARTAYMSQEQLDAEQERGAVANLVSDQYRQAGLLTCLPANNARLSGKQRVHELLRPRWDGIPYLRIMDNCPILIETLSQIQIDPKRTEDVVTEYPADAVLRDDSYDALRYLLMGLVGIERRQAAWHGPTPNMVYGRRSR